MDFQIGCCYWIISKGKGRSCHVDTNNSSVIIRPSPVMNSM